MHLRHPIKAGATALGMALALVATSAVTAAAASTVTVRVEGRTRTLLATRTVHLGTGSITRGGAPVGKCPASSAQGALATATRGDWKGSWYSSYSEYYLTGILGDSETGKRAYWGLYVNGRYATAGACDVALRPGESLVFAVVPSKGHTPELLGVQASSATVGAPFRARVVYYDAEGRVHPLAGATVRVGARKLRTGPAGNTTAITFLRAGRQTLRVSKPHYVRAEATVAVRAA